MEQTIIIRNAAMIDGVGDQLVPKVNVLIKDSKISAISIEEDIIESWKADAQENATVVDATGKYLLPGLMDCHIHVQGYAGTELVNIKMYHLTTAMPVRMLHAVRNLKYLIDGGFTTIRNCGSIVPDPIDIYLREGVKQDLIPGPRIIACGQDISMTAGHGDLFTPPWALKETMFDSEGKPQASTADGIDECIKAVRLRLRQGADFIKIHASGGVISEGDPLWWRNYRLDEVKAMCDEAHDFRRKVAAHAHGTEGIKIALRGGVDTIEHGTLMDDEGRELMLEKGAWLIPTLATLGATTKLGAKTGAPPASIEKGRQVYKQGLENFMKAYEAGVKIASGSDCYNLLKVRFNRQEFDELNDLGIPPMEIIKMATANGAKALDIADKTGTIEVGKCADLILLDDNPLTNISALGSREHTKLVMREGKVLVNKLTS